MANILPYQFEPEYSSSEEIEYESETREESEELVENGVLRRTGNTSTMRHFRDKNVRIIIRYPTLSFISW